jgi:RNA recognition motif-containing protein
MNIFVGSLSFNTTEEELLKEFEAFGKVDSVKIVLDRETLKSRGFAFVTMPNQDQAAAAIVGLNGKELKGFTLRVNEARDPGPQGGRARVNARPGYKGGQQSGPGYGAGSRSPGGGGFAGNRAGEAAGRRDLEIYDTKGGRSNSGRGKKGRSDGSRRSGGGPGGGRHFR